MAKITKKIIYVDFGGAILYNAIVRKYLFGGKTTMKKIIAILLAVLTIFSAMSVAAFATAADGDETSTIEAPPVPEGEDKTTRNIVNEDGLVVPVNETQLKFSFVFKVVEKVAKFILGIFGKDVDDALSGGVKDFGDWLDNLFADIDDMLKD